MAPCSLGDGTDDVTFDSSGFGAFYDAMAEQQHERSPVKLDTPGYWDLRADETLKLLAQHEELLAKYMLRNRRWRRDHADAVKACRRSVESLRRRRAAEEARAAARREIA